MLYDSPAVLSFPILQHCLRSEQLLIPVDPHMDIFLAHLPQYHATVALEISVQLTVPADSLRALEPAGATHAGGDQGDRRGLGGGQGDRPGP